MELPISIHTKEAPSVELHDAEAVNRAADRQLYAGRKKVYPKLVKGTFRRIKWALMALCLGIYYLVPFIRWDRGPDLPNQAVILDMEHERFFMFGLEIWPQEFYYITGLLVLAALLLFLVTSIAGRVWCGYFCPQTVWTDLMVTVERFWQGDRNKRILLDKSPWTAGKIFKKVMTHISWLVIAMATGGAFVLYFGDAPTLLKELFTGQAALPAYVFVGILTLSTYVLGGIAREQVCIYMCPWPRIQGAMVDHDSYLVSYETPRGEPRGAFRKGTSWEGRGDCIDCKACVAVCPTGIDIRDGSQLECIQCGLCIDACNEIMDKIGRPPNLIAYDSIAGQESLAKGTRAARVSIWRPRTFLYLGLMGVVGGIMLVALSMRTVLEANVLPDRNPFFVKLSNGDIRNGYTFKILNKLHEPRKFIIETEGLNNARIAVLGRENEAKPVIEVPTDVLSEQRVMVIVPAQDVKKLETNSAPFTFVVRDVDSGTITRRVTTFRSP